MYASAEVGANGANAVISSALYPTMVGTSFWAPSANVVVKSRGRAHPSTLNEKNRLAGGVAPRISSALFSRKAASDPSANDDAHFAPEPSACFSGGMPTKAPPLSPIAPWNRPRASGEAQRLALLEEPADWPKIVTRPGSPPKPRMLRFTQPSAAT